MRFQVELLLLAGLGPLLALADDIEANDFPLSCRPACQPAVDLSARCDRTTNDDRAERDCLCNSTDARAQYEACAVCIKAAPRRQDRDNDRDDDRDDGDDDNGVEELGKLMQTCNWDIRTVTASSGDGASATSRPPAPSTTDTGTGTGTGGPVVTTSVTDANGRPTVSTVTPAGATSTSTPPANSAGFVAAPRVGLTLGAAAAGAFWGLAAWL